MMGEVVIAGLDWGGANPSIHVCFFEILSSRRLIRFLEAFFDCSSFLVLQIDLMRDRNVVVFLGEEVCDCCLGMRLAD